MMHALIASAVGAASARRVNRLQSLWSGYGEVVRYALQGGPVASVVVKQVQPPAGDGLGHHRKLRSYEVEQHWYAAWAPQSRARLPRCYLAERLEEGWLFVLEDLDAAGFDQRPRELSVAELEACVRWLASFHAGFLGRSPVGLWPEGTYWHLATRPDELSTMAPGPLCEAARAIDRRLATARYQTLVHGDAKPANFCFSRHGDVAAVDFQYVGAGCGMKDLAYLLRGEGRARSQRAIEVYFAALGAALPASVDAVAVEQEWRGLYSWAWADYERFLAGWAPGRVLPGHERGLTLQVLRALESP